VSEAREPPGEGHHVDELPDREAMSVVRGDVTIPLDPDVAADVLLDQDADEDDSPG
jgi:hypothetical protein